MNNHQKYCAYSPVQFWEKAESEQEQTEGRHKDGPWASRPHLPGGKLSKWSTQVKAVLGECGKQKSF